MFSLNSTEISRDVVRDYLYYAGNDFVQKQTPSYLAKYD